MIEDWVKEEPRDVDIGDKRLDKRLMMLVSAMAKNLVDKAYSILEGKGNKEVI